MENLSRELRIGNLVYYAGIACKVLGYHHDDYLHTNCLTAPATSFQPIELTEEWLLKMGFEKEKKGYFWIKLGIEVFFNNEELIKVLYKGYKTEVKHLHQLQNLYQALTGEELTIK